jgi:purine-binding chemotaxis protein CheW
LTSTAPIFDRGTLPALLFRAGGEGERTAGSGGGGERAIYGCEIGAVQEIIPHRRATRLPGAPAYVRGLINVRGTIVTLLDLTARLEPELPPVAEGEGSILLVRQGGAGRLVGVVVGEVLDVRMVALEDRGGGGASASVVRGVGQSDDGPVILLDLDAMIKQVVLS